MTQTEALKLALEALLDLKDDCSGCEFEWSNDYRLQAKALQAIKEALAQTEQKPVAWLQFKENEPPVVVPRDLGTPVFLGIRGGLAHDAGEKP